MSIYLRFLRTESDIEETRVEAESIEEAIEKIDYAPFWEQHVAEELMDGWSKEEYDAWYGKGRKEMQKELKKKVLAERKRLANWFYNVGGPHPPYNGYMDDVEAVIVEATPEGKVTTYKKPR